MMRRYEGLFILDVAGKEDALKIELDRLNDEINKLGGKVESVQKMDFKPFARPSRHHAGGFYVNIVFEADPSSLEKFKSKLKLNESVYRVQITHAEKLVTSERETNG